MEPFGIAQSFPLFLNALAISERLGGFVCLGVQGKLHERGERGVSTINRICILQSWSTEKVVQLAVEYLEAQGQLHDFLDWLQAVAQDENEREYENAVCNICDSPINAHGFCSNPECDYYGFANDEPSSLHLLSKDEECEFADYYQDEPESPLHNQEPRLHALRTFEDGCVVANKRSRRYYLPSDGAYAKASKAKLAVFFKSEENAAALGYQRVAH